MPEMTPVATQIQPPNPGAGLGMLSSILQLKQQQQNLQTGQYQQQSAQAEASQAQQQNSELQALARFTVNASKDPSYLNPDGTPNVQKYQQDAMAVAPVYGQAYIGQMTSNFNAGVENRKALLSLGAEQQQKAAGFFGAIAAKPGATPDDLLNAAEQARGLSDDPGYQRTIDRMLMHAPQTAMMPSDKASETIRQYARQVALQANAPQAQEVIPQAGQVQTKGGIQIINTNPLAPEGAGAPMGSPVLNAIPPGTVTSPITHGTAAYGPGGTGITPIGAGGGGSNGAGGGGSNKNGAGSVNPWQPKPGQPQNIHTMAQDDASRYKQISQEGTNAQTGAQLADQVSELAEQVRTGKLSKEWADRLTVLQQHDPSLTARQMLSKYAAQLKTMAEQGASTDASREQIDAGMPSPDTMGPDAVERAAEYVGGIFRMRGARQAYADQYVKSNGSSVGIRGADDSFMSSADPSVFAYNALPEGQKRQEFLKERFGNDPTKIRAFISRLNQVRHYAGAIQ